jgi:hypothetical protein
MSGEALGMKGIPPWDGKLIHYTCDPTRSDIVLRMSHMIADGQLILKLLLPACLPAAAAGSCLQRMVEEALGSNRLPSWSRVLIHYTCNSTCSCRMLLLLLLLLMLPACR